MKSTNNLEEEEGKIIGRVFGQLLTLVIVVFICGFFINRHNSSEEVDQKATVENVDSSESSASVIDNE